MDQAAGRTLSAAYEELAAVSRACDATLAESMRRAASRATATERAEPEMDRQCTPSAPTGFIRLSEFVKRLLTIIQGRSRPLR